MSFPAPVLLALSMQVASGSALPPTPIIPVPPPPPPADSEPLRSQIETARACFDEQWEASRSLRWQAEAAVRDLTPESSARQWTNALKVVTSYIEGRDRIDACLQELQVGARGLVHSANDIGALSHQVQMMIFNRDGQTPNENRILRKLVATAPSLGAP